MNILIVGASGNLGTHITTHFRAGPHQLRLMTHTTPPVDGYDTGGKVSIIRADLNVPATLDAATRDIDCIVYVAGVLFRPRPEAFLHRTNTIYVQNIVDAAVKNRVGKFILVSFPHVEGESTPASPARGKLDAKSDSIHSRTRLAAEKYLFAACKDMDMTPVVLRVGVIYGRGVKLIETARSLMRRRLLAIWKQPTWLHLIALPDFLRIVESAIERPDLFGIYNICDDCPVMLQKFLDELADHWGYRKPWRLPDSCFYLAAATCELLATILRSRTPLTRDMIRMAMTSVVADTSRMKQEIQRKLLYPTFWQGLAIV